MQVDADTERDDDAAMAPPDADPDFSTDDDDYPEARGPLPPRRRLAIGLVLALGIAAWSACLLWLALRLFG